MSIFAALQGDVWTIAGINFASPINDILEKSVFTLEELLQEDEILQEVKSRNTRLLEFITQEDTIDKLINYVIEPAGDESDDLRKFKYPYMSCEIFCCEIADILRVLVEEYDGRFLMRLFSLLEKPSPIDHFLAGYFEKILEVLFRRMTVPVMKYLNDGGADLLQWFLRHIENYSIMQVVQRLMLPHIPFSAIDTTDIGSMIPAERQKYQCNWSFLGETCDILITCMLTNDSSDVSSHISDLLITVIQLSPPDAPILKNLADSKYFKTLLAVAMNNSAGDLESIHELGPLSLSSFTSVASISVVESLISRLCEAMSTADADLDNNDSDGSISSRAKECVLVMCQSMKEYFPQLASELNNYRTKPVGDIINQQKIRSVLLGNRGLYLVKLIESIVRVGNASTDDELCRSGVIAAVIDLLFFFKTHSILHLSIQRLIIMIVEGGISRRSAYRHLLVDCVLLDRLMDHIEENMQETAFYMRSPLFGHLIQISQAITTSWELSANSDKEAGGMGIELEKHSLGLDGNDMSSSSSSESTLEELAASSTNEPVKCFLGRDINLERWDIFVDTTLKKLLANQMVSGSSSDESQNQMSVAMQNLGMQLNAILNRNPQNAQFCGDFDDDDDDDDDAAFSKNAEDSVNFDAFQTSFADFDQGQGGDLGDFGNFNTDIGDVVGQMPPMNFNSSTDDDPFEGSPQIIEELERGSVDSHFSSGEGNTQLSEDTDSVI